MTSEKEYIPKSAMSIHAHPDDQDFTVAGTLAKWAAAGCEITTVIITDGSAGSNDPQHGPDYWPILARIRANEQRSANAILGVKETIFLGYPDGELEATLARCDRQAAGQSRRFGQARPRAVSLCAGQRPGLRAQHDGGPRRRDRSCLRDHAVGRRHRLCRPSLVRSRP